MLASICANFRHAFPSLTEMIHDHDWVSDGLKSLIKPLFVGMFEVS